MLPVILITAIILIVITGRVNPLWVYSRRRDSWPFFPRKTVLKPFIRLTVTGDLL
jgi:hypothetical protein